MKKLISVVLTLTVCAAVFVPAAASAASFTDLTDAHWAYDNIMRLANDGTINGYDDGTFLPEGTVTRAEFVKMLGKSDTAPFRPIHRLCVRTWQTCFTTATIQATCLHRTA